MSGLPSWLLLSTALVVLVAADQVCLLRDVLILQDMRDIISPETNVGVPTEREQQRDIRSFYTNRVTLGYKFIDSEENSQEKRSTKPKQWAVERNFNRFATTKSHRPGYFNEVAVKRRRLIRNRSRELPPQEAPVAKHLPLHHITEPIIAPTTPVPSDEESEFFADENRATEPATTRRTTTEDPQTTDPVNFFAERLLHTARQTRFVIKKAKNPVEKKVMKIKKGVVVSRKSKTTPAPTTTTKSPKTTTPEKSPKKEEESLESDLGFGSRRGPVEFPGDEETVEPWGAPTKAESEKPIAPKEELSGLVDSGVGFGSKRGPVEFPGEEAEVEPWNAPDSSTTSAPQQEETSPPESRNVPKEELSGLVDSGVGVGSKRGPVEFPGEEAEVEPWNAPDLSTTSAPQQEETSPPELKNGSAYKEVPVPSGNSALAFGSKHIPEKFHGNTGEVEHWNAGPSLPVPDTLEENKIPQEESGLSFGSKQGSVEFPGDDVTVEPWDVSSSTATQTEPSSTAEPTTIKTSTTKSRVLVSAASVYAERAAPEREDEEYEEDETPTTPLPDVAEVAEALKDVQHENEEEEKSPKEKEKQPTFGVSSFGSHKGPVEFLDDKNNEVEAWDAPRRPTGHFGPHPAPKHAVTITTETPEQPEEQTEEEDKMTESEEEEALREAARHEARMMIQKMKAQRRDSREDERRELERLSREEALREEEEKRNQFEVQTSVTTTEEPIEETTTTEEPTEEPATQATTKWLRPTKRVVETTDEGERPELSTSYYNVYNIDGDEVVRVTTVKPPPNAPVAKTAGPPRIYNVPTDEVVQADDIRPQPRKVGPKRIVITRRKTLESRDASTQADNDLLPTARPIRDSRVRVRTLAPPYEPSPSTRESFTSQPPLTQAEQIFADQQLRQICNEVRSAATQFGINDVKSFAAQNCALIKLYYPHITCEQINSVVQYCGASQVPFHVRLLLAKARH